MYKRKTRDIWEFQLNYGHGWEYETTETTAEGMRENRKAYRSDCLYPLRIIRRRERVQQDAREGQGVTHGRKASAT